jgi:hypothetical protein
VLLPTHAGEHDLTPSQRIMFMTISVGLVIAAGLMSGLTLGLMSMDLVELEVLKRSGTAKEQKYSAAIYPIVSNQHFLLVTLLLCNACAMEALPLFLDRLADPVTAILISVTAVLVFGEVLPQAVCSRCVLQDDTISKCTQLHSISPARTSHLPADQLEASLQCTDQRHAVHV